MVDKGCYRWRVVRDTKLHDGFLLRFVGLLACFVRREVRQVFWWKINGLISFIYWTDVEDINWNILRIDDYFKKIFFYFFEIWLVKWFI